MNEIFVVCMEVAILSLALGLSYFDDLTSLIFLGNGLSVIMLERFKIDERFIIFCVCDYFQILQFASVCLQHSPVPEELFLFFYFFGTDFLRITCCCRCVPLRCAFSSPYTRTCKSGLLYVVSNRSVS